MERSRTVVPGHRRGRPAAGGTPRSLAPPRLVALLSAFHPAIQSHFLRVLRLAWGVGVRPRMDLPRQRTPTLGSQSPVPGSTSPPFPPASRRDSQGCGVHPSSPPLLTPPRLWVEMPRYPPCFSASLSCVYCSRQSSPAPGEGRRGARRRKTAFVVVQLYPATLPHHSPPGE